jgi:hypothetical protein
MRPRQNISRGRHQVGVYDQYPLERDDAAEGTERLVDDCFRNPYAVPALGPLRTHNPYKPHTAQAFTAIKVHPIFRDDASVFEACCSRYFYDEVVEFDNYSPTSQNSVRLVVKNFPLVHLWQRREVLAGVLAAATKEHVSVAVEAPRPSRTNPQFFDALVFMWVPAWAVGHVLSLSGRILCDMDSFLIEHGDPMVLQAYGQFVRDRLSQDQRHHLTRGLPHKPLEFAVSTSQ